MATYDVTVADDVLAFFNAVNDPHEIRDRIHDDPNMGASRPYGIGLSVANSILAERLALGREFKTLAELDAVKGVGRDTFHNILYSFRPKTEAAALYRSFQSAIEFEGEVYPREGNIIHEDEQFEVRLTVKNVADRADRTRGIPGVVFAEIVTWFYPAKYATWRDFGQRPSQVGPAPGWARAPFVGGDSRTDVIVLDALAVNDGVTAPIATFVACAAVDVGCAEGQGLGVHSYFRVDKSLDVYHPILKN